MITDSRLANLLSREAAQAVSDWQSDIGKEQTRALRYYHGEKFDGDDDEAMDTWSKVVSRDVAEVVDWSLPEIVKLFLEREQIGEFQPRLPEYEQMAEQASEYLNYVFYNDNDGFNILHDQAKDGLLQKIGVVRVFWDEAAEATRETLDGLDEEAVNTLYSEQENDETEILAVEQDDDGTYTVKIERRDMGLARVECIPPENFLISRQGDDEDLVPYIAARFRKTVSELIADGYDKNLVMGLGDSQENIDNSSGDFERHSKDQIVGHNDNEDPSQREYWVYEEYARVDVDEDGESELVHAVRVGSTILEWEEVSEQPFCVFTPNRMPHRVIGRALADDVIDIQEINTVLWREALDNQALINRPQREVPAGAIIPDQTIPDLLTPRIGGILRTKQPNMVRDIVTPDISASSLNMIELSNRVKESRTGVSRHQQGLESDTLHSTKGGMERLMSEGQGRRDLIVRHFANTLKKTLEKMYRLICRHQDKERTIRLRGEWVPMDPRTWDSKMTCEITVGIGTASDAEKRQNAMALLQVQREAIAGGMVMPNNMMNGLTKFVETLNIGPVEDFFTEAQPQGEKPDPEMEMKQQELQFKQQEAEAKIVLEKEKAAASLQLEREKAALNAQLEREKADREAQMARQRFEIEMQLKREEMQAQIDLKYTEIAVKGNTNENVRSPVRS